MSSTSPASSTARHSQPRSPVIIRQSSSRCQQPVAKSHGLRVNGAEFPLEQQSKQKLARFLCFSSPEGEFSVDSQAVQHFTTACWMFEHAPRVRLNRRAYSVPNPQRPEADGFVRDFNPSGQHQFGHVT
jgi:uncharacterized protein YfaP (DUF2135 family)